MDVTLNLYSADVSTGSGKAIEAANGAKEMTWYLSWLISDTTNNWPASGSTKIYDAAIGTFTITPTAGPPDTIVVDWKSTSEIKDVTCAEATCSATAPTDDVTNDAGGTPN